MTTPTRVLDAAAVSKAVRAVAGRVHRALRAGSRGDARELRDVARQVDVLLETISSEGGREDLRQWLEALRRQVACERGLGDFEGAPPRGEALCGAR